MKNTCNTCRLLFGLNALEATSITQKGFFKRNEKVREDLEKC